MAQRHTRTATPRPRIVVVGANFAGLTAAQHLGQDYAVTVIDRTPAFEWLPNIHELLSGAKAPALLRLSRSRLVRRAGHRFVRAEVVAIDAPASQVVTADGRSISFDACIVAVGGVNDPRGVPGAERYAMPFKSVDHCWAIGRRLARLARRPGPLSIVVVGGGIEGVEAVGEVLRRYRNRQPTLHVIEGGARLLSGTPAALDAAVRACCAPHDVHVHTNTRVAAVAADHVALSTGRRVEADLTIWTGGATPPPLLQASGLAAAPRRWAPVTAALRSRAHDAVFVIGDAAHLPHPLAKQASYAMQMGACAAANVVRALAGRPLRPFVPAAKPMLVALGDLNTFLVSGDTVIAAPALAALKEAVFQMTMAAIDPPTERAAWDGARARLGAAMRLALSTAASPAALARLTRVRIESVPALPSAGRAGAWLLGTASHA